MPTDDQPHRTFSKTDSKSARCSELNPLRLEDTSIPGDICQSWHFYSCTRSHILTRYPKAYPSCGRRHCWSPAATIKRPDFFGSDCRLSTGREIIATSPCL